MNRSLTNFIRYCMDEWIPPAIRDRSWFMRAFYWAAYRGKNIDQHMNFKSMVYQFSPEEYKQYYNSLDSISRNRITDLNQQCIDFVMSRIHPDAMTLLDVGCGHGFLLREIHKRHSNVRLSGLDIMGREAPKEYEFIEGNIENLPFPDQSFDVVVCCHTLEHLINLDKCIAELLRVCRKQLLIVVPRQRYFFYTLDEHVNFFPHQHLLTHRIPLAHFDCQDLGGDWAYQGFVETKGS